MLNVQAPLMLKKKFWNFKEELELTWLRNHEARPTLGILQTFSFINDTNQLLPNNLKLTLTTKMQKIFSEESPLSAPIYWIYN